MNFKDYLNENDTLKDPATKLAKEMEDVVKKIFPNSMVEGEYSSKLGKSVTLWFTLGNGKSEYHNGIEHNDPARTILKVWFGRAEEMPEKMTLEMVAGGSIAVNPEEGSHLAMARHKVPFRKASGDSKKMVAATKKYFEKLHGELKKVKGDIYGVNELPYNIEDKL